MNWYITVLKKYFEFNGRARRSEFWYYVLINFIISVAINLIAYQMPSLAILSTIYGLGVLIPGIAVSIRRMHDVDKSGWFILIPIYNIILAATEGTKGSNQFGADPKAAA